MSDLQLLIEKYVILGSPNLKGWMKVKCQLCHDYQERGAFNFLNNTVLYNCFNCGEKVKHDNSSRKISDKVKNVLTSFGIPEDEIKKVIGLQFFKSKDEIIENINPDGTKKPVVEFPNKECKLPDGSISVTSNESPWCEVARLYLRSRGFDPFEHPYYVTENKTYEGRVIIPYEFRGKIIYWQGRSLDSSIEPRYKNPIVEKDNIFFNMDEIYRYTNEPLFVTEGPLDARSIGRNAVATLGSSLSEFHFRELKKAAIKRKVIFVIDKNKNGFKLGSTVLENEDLEWYVAVFPDNIEDANDALIELGRLFMATHLVTTAAKGFQGKLLLKMKCFKG